MTTSNTIKTGSNRVVVELGQALFIGDSTVTVTIQPFKGSSNGYSFSTYSNSSVNRVVIELGQAFFVGDSTVTVAIQLSKGNSKGYSYSAYSNSSNNRVVIELGQALGFVCSSERSNRSEGITIAWF